MLKGHLEHFALADIFRLLSWAKKTGKLEVVRSAGRGKIFFRDGDVYYAESSLSREPLGQKLIRSGSLSEGQLMKALDVNAQSGERVGQILVANGWVTDEQLQEALKQQIEDAVFDLLRWELGEFEYQPFVEADIEVQISVSVENLIIEASRRLDELEVIQRKIPSEESVLRMASKPPEGAAEINITPEEWRMLVLVDGQRDVHQIAQLVGIDDFGALRGLYGLVSAGLVEVVGGEHESVPGMEESVAAFDKKPEAHAPPPSPEQMSSQPPFESHVTVDEPVATPVETVPVPETPEPEPTPEPVVMERTAQSVLEQPAVAEPAEHQVSETAFQADPDTGTWDAATMSSVFHVEEAGDGNPVEAQTTFGDQQEPSVTPAAEMPVEPVPVESFDAPQPGDIDTVQPDPFLNDLLADQPVGGGESPAPPAPSAHQPQVDRSTVVKELAGLFSDDERPQRPAGGASPDGESPAEQRKRLEDDDQLNRGLITRLIDGVKGL